MSKFTITQVVFFGAGRQWKPLGKRAFKEFRTQFGLPAPVSAGAGIQASIAFERCYQYLRAAGEQERYELGTMMDQAAAWSAVKTRSRFREAEQLAQRERDLAEQRRQRDAMVEANRERRAWRLCGMYLEDRTMAKYTLTELEAWQRWAAYWRFTPHTAVIRVECVDAGENAMVTLDWSDLFVDYCGEGRPFDFDAMCKDLYDYTEQRRRDAAPHN